MVWCGVLEYGVCGIASRVQCGALCLVVGMAWMLCCGVVWCGVPSLKGVSTQWALCFHGQCSGGADPLGFRLILSHLCSFWSGLFQCLKCSYSGLLALPEVALGLFGDPLS